MNKRYKKYLFSEEWGQIKVDLIQIRGAKCERCKCARLPTKLQVHHLTYDRIFNEEPEDLILLCASCHMKEHGIKKATKKIPVIKKNKRKSPIKKIKERAARGKYKTINGYKCAMAGAKTREKNRKKKYHS